MSYNPYYDKKRTTQKPREPIGSPVKVIAPKPLGENFADMAERAIEKHLQRKEFVTSSKLRGIYALFLDIYNKEILRNEEKLSKGSLDKLKMLHVKILYDAGRDTQEKKKNPLKDFIEDTDIISYIKDIGDSREKFIKTTQYFEALVAFHRYYSSEKSEKNRR
jgi:CRISPR-associated protein Csm2